MAIKHTYERAMSYRAAYIAGCRARREGLGRDACPPEFAPDHRPHWLDGWDDVDAELRKEG